MFVFLLRCVFVKVKTSVLIIAITRNAYIYRSSSNKFFLLFGPNMFILLKAFLYAGFVKMFFLSQAYIYVALCHFVFGVSYDIYIFAFSLLYSFCFYIFNSLCILLNSNIGSMIMLLLVCLFSSF